MKVEEIRPDALMKKHNRLRNSDIRELLAQKREFVYVACPACECKKSKKLFKKTGFTFVKCTVCETVYVNPRPTLKLLTTFYTTSKSIKFWSDKIYPLSEKTRKLKIFRPRAIRVVDLCKKYKIAQGTLLDVGAGYGTFCREIARLHVFKKIFAVEPSHDLAESCRKKSITVIEKAIEEVKNTDIDTIDVITNFELIEHLFKPKDFLSSCARLLKKEGLLILTTPNINGFDLLTLGKISDNINGPNHINYFHPQSLSMLLEDCGFQTVEILTPGKLDAELVRNKAIKGSFNISYHPFLENILIKNWETLGKKFQNFLSSNNLSSHLWIVAKKI